MVTCLLIHNRCNDVQEGRAKTQISGSPITHHPSPTQFNAGVQVATTPSAWYVPATNSPLLVTTRFQDYAAAADSPLALALSLALSLSKTLSHSFTPPCARSDMHCSSPARQHRTSSSCRTACQQPTAAVTPCSSHPKQGFVAPTHTRPLLLSPCNSRPPLTCPLQADPVSSNTAAKVPPTLTPCHTPR